MLERIYKQQDLYRGYLIIVCQIFAVKALLISSFIYAKLLREIIKAIFYIKLYAVNRVA